MIDVRVVEKQGDSGGRGPFRAFFDWLTGAAARPSPDDPGATTRAAAGTALPARIGHYAIAHKLGEGGMGVVYAARDDRLERTVALKMISSLADDETARQRLWREARAAASVNHPNVCQIYEIGEDAGELFIAMELLEGEALAERLRRGALSAAEAIPIGLGILAALAALHARGIVHRDLKPSNVFLTKHGVKLLDFGLARPELDGALDEDTGLTRTGIVMGTPRYMAPEQVIGEPVDARSDLFAAGAHPVRDAGGPARVRGPDGCRSAARDAVRAAAGARRIEHRRRGRSRHSPGAGEAAGGPAGVGRRHGGRAARDPRPRVASATRRRRWRARSRASSCSRSACCGPIPRPTFLRSACPTRSRRRCRATAVSSCGRAQSPRASPPRRPISRRSPPRGTSIAW